MRTRNAFCNTLSSEKMNNIERERSIVETQARRTAPALCTPSEIMFFRRKSSSVDHRGTALQKQIHYVDALNGPRASKTELAGLRAKISRERGDTSQGLALVQRVCGTRRWPAAVTGSSLCPTNRAKLPCGVEKNARSNSCLAHFESLSLAPPNPSAEVETASSSPMTTAVVCQQCKRWATLWRITPNGQTKEHRGSSVGSRLVISTTHSNTSGAIAPWAAAVAMRGKNATKHLQQQYTWDFRSVLSPISEHVCEAVRGFSAQEKKRAM